MYGRREKLHILLQWEKTCICLSDRYKLSPTLHRQHICEGAVMVMLIVSSKDVCIS